MIYSLLEIVLKLERSYCLSCLKIRCYYTQFRYCVESLRKMEYLILKNGNGKGSVGYMFVVMIIWANEFLPCSLILKLTLWLFETIMFFIRKTIHCVRKSSFHKNSMWLLVNVAAIMFWWRIILFLHSVTGKEASAASLRAGVWRVVLLLTRVESQYFPLQHLEPTGFPIYLIPSAESLSIQLLRTILHVYFHCVSKLNRTKGYNILTALRKACV